MQQFDNVAKKLGIHPKVLKLHLSKSPGVSYIIPFIGTNVYVYRQGYDTKYWTMDELDVMQLEQNIAQLPYYDRQRLYLMTKCFNEGKFYRQELLEHNHKIFRALVQKHGCEHNGVIQRIAINPVVKETGIRPVDHCWIILNSNIPVPKVNDWIEFKGHVRKYFKDSEEYCGTAFALKFDSYTTCSTEDMENWIAEIKSKRQQKYVR